MWQLHSVSVWSRPGAVYFGCSYDLFNLPQDESPFGIFVNQGRGWSDFLDLHALGFDGMQLPQLIMRGVPGTDTLWLGASRFVSGSVGPTETGVFRADATEVAFASDGGLAVEHLFVVDAETAYATDGDLVARFSDGLWEPLPVRVPYGVRRLWASRTALWGVGNQGNIVSYEIDHWQSHASGTLEGLSGIWGFADDDLWVMEGLGNLLHWDGESWSSVPWPDSPAGFQPENSTMADFTGLWGADGVLYLYGSTLFARYDTRAANPSFELLLDWRCLDPSRTCAVEIEIKDLWGNAPDEVFLAVAQQNAELHDDGWYSAGRDAFLLYFDGEQFHWF